MKLGAKGLGAVIAIDRGSERPVYAQIADGLRTAIEDGTLLPGARLASTRSLATDWGVSRNTVLQAFEALLAEGYLEGRVGDGTYVTGTPPANPSSGPSQTGETAGQAGPQRLQPYPFRALSRRGRSVIARLPRVTDERVMPFTPDVPDLAEFPMRSWLRLMNEVSGRLTGEALAGVAPAGFGPLRTAIAHHVSVTRGLRCTQGQVIVTTGSQQSLDLVVRLLADRGDPVWIEDPGYVGMRAVLTANGCNLQPIPVDAEGIDVPTGITMALCPRMICVSAARQYPTGALLSPTRRQALLDFANQCGAWIVEDDYDAEFQYLGPPPRALAAEDGAGRVVMIGTFSKTLVPSLRLGYLVVPADLAGAFEIASGVAQGNSPLVEQMVLAEMMHRGIYAAHVRRMRVLYRERQTALCAALEQGFGYRPSAVELRSGMHVVLPLRDGIADTAVAATLAQARIVARPLSPYAMTEPRRQGLLLGFAAFSPERLSDAVARMAAVREIRDALVPSQLGCA